MLNTERVKHLQQIIRLKASVYDEALPVTVTKNFVVLGNYFFNLYLVLGSRFTALIEMGTSAIVDTVIEQLGELNVSPNYLVLTHPHADHVTGIEGLRERFPEATVVAGQGSKEFLSHPKAREAALKEDSHISDMLSLMGIKPGRPSITTPPCLEKHITVTDQCNIDLGDISLQCSKVRGHAPGNVIVNIPELGILLVSDSLGFHYPGSGVLPLYFTGYEDYICTLNKLAMLKPTILGFGHQGFLTGQDVPNAFEEAFKATSAILSRIMNHEKKIDEIANEIFNDYYRDEFLVYSEENIKNCAYLLVRRSVETLSFSRITQ